MHPLETERLQEIEIEIREIADAIEPGRVVRLAKAGMLRRVNRKALRQFFEERHPAGMPAGAVQKDERLRIASLGAAAQHADVGTVNCHDFRAVRHPPISLTRRVCKELCKTPYASFDTRLGFAVTLLRMRYVIDGINKSTSS
jgi:hypothetical protein